MDTKHTPGPWETVGATRIWKTGEGGGAVAMVVEPECRTSRDFNEVEIGSKRWKEAMANAELIVKAPAMADLLRRLVLTHPGKDVDGGIPNDIMDLQDEAEKIRTCILDKPN